MSSMSKLRKSRDSWKKKAVERGKSERCQRKEKIRIGKERDRYKKEAREARKELERERRRRALPVCGREDVVCIALMLFLVARISFRAVSRVMGVLAGYLGTAWTPCPQTVVNWVVRLSVARIRDFSQPVGRKTGDPFSNGFIWMIDTTMGLGTGRILAVVAIDAGHHAANETAPALRQVRCVAVSVAASWTGETMADFLQKVIAVTGRPAAYLKDGGTDLAKAVRLLEERGMGSPSVDDVSHIAANLLRHEYQNHPMFETFVSACGRVSKKLKQTVLACLAPPKVSAKGRFMNLHRLVRWADRLLRHSPKGRSPKGSVLSRLRSAIDQIPKCRNFISRFLRDADSLLACQRILKSEGLSRESYEECKKLLEAVPPRSSVRQGFADWAERQLGVAAGLGLENTGMPVSSDSIESLFGVSKQHGTGGTKDANRIALRIPAMCGEVTREDARRVLNVSVREQQEVTACLPSLTKQRRDILPNPGSLEKIITDGKKQNLELIPMTKNRSNNLTNLNIAGDCGETAVPPTDPGKQEKPPPEVRIPIALAA